MRYSQLAIANSSHYATSSILSLMCALFNTVINVVTQVPIYLNWGHIIHMHMCIAVIVAGNL